MVVKRHRGAACQLHLERWLTSGLWPLARPIAVWSASVRRQSQTSSSTKITLRSPKMGPTSSTHHMPSIHPCELPNEALLGKYQNGGAYADCYVTEMDRHVSHSEYVEAFYTTPLFKLERLLLAWLVSKPSTDAQASQLASGSLDSFAAWSVEGRREDQLLMCDFQGRTRSWLMIVPMEGESDGGTRLYFGSAVVPARTARADAPPDMGLTFRFLLGFHKLYSRALLFSAKYRLMRQQPKRR